MRHWHSLLGFCLVAAVSMALQPAAWAKEEFPGKVARALGAPTPPPCGLCHQFGKTGGDTLVTPFAWAMRARGLTGESTLDEALARVEADRVDSDGDGVTDTDEIIAATDPNSPASTPATGGPIADPQLGCSVAAGRQPVDVAGIVLLVCLGAFGRRRARNPTHEDRP